MRNRQIFLYQKKLHVYDLEIDKHGITYHQQEFLGWKEICATGIKSERFIKSRYESYYEKHLLVILHSGEIIQFLLGDISNLKGLLGHFIELYKIENSII